MTPEELERMGTWHQPDRSPKEHKIIDPRDEPGSDKEMPFFTGVTLREVWSVACPECGALVAERCRAVGGFQTGTHRGRIKTAQETKR